MTQKIRSSHVSTPPGNPQSSQQPAGVRHFDDPGPYWVLWNQQHGLPKIKHRSYSEALSIARDMAKKNPGQKFRILKSVAAIIISKEINTSGNV